MNNRVTIISFTYPHEAHLAMAYLDSNGIEVIIKDELTAQVNNFYSNAIGGVKLIVDSEDAEKALALLKEGGYIQEPEEKQPKDKLETFSPEATKECPYCKSKNIAKKKQPGYVIAFSILLLGFPLPFLK